MNKEIAIVMIDDNKRDHDAFSIALNDLHINYHCRFIQTVEDAIRLLHNLVPDYIFIDMSMLNSTACFRRIKKIQALKNVPLIAYSNSVDEDGSKAKLFQNGADICISKALGSPDLIKLLKQILNKNSDAEETKLN